MSKTAEELITKLDEYARDVDHEYLGLPTYQEHQPAMELMVNNYAEQQAVEFAEWVAPYNYYGKGIWVGFDDVQYTTSDLYKLFTQQKQK